MFAKILIANRGEIACRIIRACHKLEISAVAVYSTADKDSLHVQLADEAFLVGEAAPEDSYLNMDTILKRPGNPVPRRFIPDTDSCRKFRIRPPLSGGRHLLHRTQTGSDGEDGRQGAGTKAGQKSGPARAARHRGRRPIAPRRKTWHGNWDFP